MELTESHEAAFTPPGTEDDHVEQREVLKWKGEIDRARQHDRPARAQYALDRRYAAGTANPDKAVTTNLVGNYIDILVDYLYAKNPDISARPAEEVTSSMPELPLVPPQPPLDANDPVALEQFAVQQAAFAEEQAQRQQQQFARRQKRAERQDLAATIQIVVSKLWKNGRLKKAARKQVRSCLSVGPGWFKAVMLVERETDPQIEATLNDLRDNLARIHAKRQELIEQIPEDLELAERELEEQIASVEPKLEIALRKGLAIDFCGAETVTVSTDVAFIDDYLDAGWISNHTFVKKSELKAKFPRLTDEEVKAATSYFMRSPRETIQPSVPLEDRVHGLDDQDASEADQFVSEKSGGGPSQGDEHQDEAFAKVVEIWDRRANNIKTMIEGVKRWAREPFNPKYATSRFYPYFYLAFYEVDGSRHPQSCSWRLSKLQDEYEDTRSKFRLTRKRATPGVLFHKGQVSKDNARDIETAVEQEYVGVEPTNPGIPLDQLFAAKPIAVGDMALYDTTPITKDMEKISGVQEALQSSASRRPNMTATEAEIEQSGFSTRVQADQDAIDDMLTDFAEYTTELALQCLTYEEVKRMAGPDAFWPEGLPIEEITTLVEVDIEAGSTGRPNRSAERQAWSTMLPLIRQDIIAIQQARAVGNEPLAKALIALLQETFRVMGGRGDVERFIPDPAPMGVPLPAPGGLPGQPPADATTAEPPAGPNDPRALTTGNTSPNPQLQ